VWAADYIVVGCAQAIVLNSGEEERCRGHAVVREISEGDLRGWRTDSLLKTFTSVTFWWFLPYDHVGTSAGGRHIAAAGGPS
jgi:hypothetical protein